jgi:hypothetical protein
LPSGVDNKWESSENPVDKCHEHRIMQIGDDPGREPWIGSDLALLSRLQSDRRQCGFRETLVSAADEGETRGSVN